MNTFERMHLTNKNEKTAKIAAKLGEYIKAFDGIANLQLTVDGKTYEVKYDSVKEDSELYKACATLKNAENIDFTMRSSAETGLLERLRDGFMSDFSSDKDICENISYKSTDCSDERPKVLLCAYGENGLCYPHDDFSEGVTAVSDIKEWFCCCPKVAISGGIEGDGLRGFFMEKLEQICKINGDMGPDYEDSISDDWDNFGEIILESGVSFTAETLPELLSVFGEINEKSKKNSLEFELEICAIPDGDGDYDFAAIKIFLENGEIKTHSVRF